MLYCAYASFLSIPFYVHVCISRCVCVWGGGGGVEGVGLTDNRTIVFLGKFGIFPSGEESLLFCFVFPWKSSRHLNG